MDGAFFNDFHMAGIGAITRDYHGKVLFATSMKEQDVQDPKTIETLVVLRGLQLSMHLEITHIIVEMDCN